MNQKCFHHIHILSKFSFAKQTNKQTKCNRFTLDGNIELSIYLNACRKSSWLSMHCQVRLGLEPGRKADSTNGLRQIIL